MRRLLLIVVCLLWGALGIATDIPELHDPLSAKRYDVLIHELRCLKCEHQSVAESDADFSKDVKSWVAQAIIAGRSDQEIKDMLQSRFGDRIFLNPPWQWNTYILWLLPMGLCVMGCWAWLRRVRK